MTNPYPQQPIVNKPPLPDLFRLPSTKERITSTDQWPQLANEWRDLIVDMEYAGLPPQPESIEFECHSVKAMNSWPTKPKYFSYKIHCFGGTRPISIGVKILFPDTDQAVPALIDGGACVWRKETIAQEVVARNYALVLFDRTEVAKDAPDRTVRRGGLYDIYPDESFQALGAWAWAYHRCVDLLHTLDYIDSERIAITGHSRGGKTTLLAGATDQRISLVNDNASCAAGGALFRYVGDGGETIKIHNAFPDWFHPDFGKFINKEEALPFDQHCLVASFAPRPLLLSYALDDRWSNPEGMVQCYWAAREAWRFLGVEEKIAFHFRPGGHGHLQSDWIALLDFMDWQWHGTTPQTTYNVHPYDHLKPMADWTAPNR